MNNISDETCSNYQARGWTNGVECSAQIKCRNCNPTGPCFVPESYYIYSAQDSGAIFGVTDMMNEIY